MRKLVGCRRLGFRGGILRTAGTNPGEPERNGRSSGKADVTFRQVNQAKALQGRIKQSASAVELQLPVCPLSQTLALARGDRALAF
jgi:hypothetical protein